jgi:hypothetical protein
VVHAEVEGLWFEDRPASIVIVSPCARCLLHPTIRVPFFVSRSYAALRRTALPKLISERWLAVASVRSWRFNRRFLLVRNPLGVATTGHRVLLEVLSYFLSETKKSRFPAPLWWAHLGSNQGPPACEAGALPLSYAPRAPHPCGVSGQSSDGSRGVASVVASGTLSRGYVPL